MYVYLHKEISRLLHPYTHSQAIVKSHSENLVNESKCTKDFIIRRLASHFSHGYLHAAMLTCKTLPTRRLLFMVLVFCTRTPFPAHTAQTSAQAKHG